MRRPCVSVDNSVLSTIDLKTVCQFDFVIADMDMTHTVQISTRTVVCVYVYVYIIIYIAMYICIYIIYILYAIFSRAVGACAVFTTPPSFKKLLDLVECMGVGGGRELRWHVFACGKQLVKLH